MISRYFTMDLIHCSMFFFVLQLKKIFCADSLSMISFSNRWNGDSHRWSYISASSQKNGGLSFKANCRNKSLLWKVLGRLMLTTYLSVFLLQTYMRIKCNRQSRLSGKFQNTSWPKEACPEIIRYLWRHSVGWLISKYIVCQK